VKVCVHPPWRHALLAGLLASLGLFTGCGITTPSLAQRLADGVSVQAIQRDLAALQKIADDNGGTRADGTAGYDASVSMVATTLRRLGYHVQLDTLRVPVFSEVGTPTLTIPGGPALRDSVDFRAMVFSGSGDVTARAVVVGFDPTVDPIAFSARPTGTGCDASDLPAETKGAILLLQPGPCFRRAQVLSAQQAGAAAVVISWPQWEPGFVLRPALINPEGIHIPAIAATKEVGLALAGAADAKALVHLHLQTATVDRSVSSVIAETPGGDPSHVLMLGGHLDTATEGPGINDNGSGTMTLLELAREIAASGAPRLKVRFGFWAGEELGLWGSRHYVLGLGSAQRSAIDAYLNFDMLASPNGERIVYADSGAPSGSEKITQLFSEYFTGKSLTHAELDLGGASDHFSFAQAGILTGGLFSGANEYKTDTEAHEFGGSAGTLLDECYHRACDRTNHLDATLLEQMAKAAAYATGEIASGDVALPH
jgi:Zn-dependent M28 family amino/carboxypeptidase